MGKFDKIVCCGDLAECVFNERGMIADKDIKEVKKFKALLELRVNASTEDFHYIPGDHELGYILPLSCDPKGGMSWESINNFQSVFGPLFQGFKIGSFNFLLLSSSLFVQELKPSPCMEAKNYYKLKQDQLNFIWEFLKDKKKDEKVFIFLHDPDAIETLNSWMFSPWHVKRDVFPGREYKVFCGHMHAEGSLEKYQKLGRIARATSSGEKLLRWLFNQNKKGRKVMNWARGNPRRMEVFRKYDLRIVPSTAGMMGKGGGFLILNLFSDGSYSIEKHKI